MKQVIAEVMEEEGVDPNEIPKDSHINPSDLQQIKKTDRYFRCKGFVSFNVHITPSGRQCKHTWKSAHAWCVLDLKKQRIVHRWCQECRLCGGEYEPWFDEEALERMAEYAVNFYLVRVGRREWKQRDDDYSIESDDSSSSSVPIGPHDEARCDMCKELGCSCWKSAQHGDDDKDYTESDEECTDEDDYDSGGGHGQYYDDEYGDNYEYEYGYDDDYNPYY